MIECEATKQTRKFSWIMDRLVGTWHPCTFSWKKVKLTANQVFLLVNPNPIALSTCLWLCSQPDFCSDSQGVTWIELSLLINSSQPIIAQLIGYHVNYSHLLHYYWPVTWYLINGWSVVLKSTCSMINIVKVKRWHSHISMTKLKICVYIHVIVRGCHQSWWCRWHWW